MLVTSGVGWDREANFVDAPLEKWMAWRELYPISTAYMDQGEPLYDDLKLLFSPPDPLNDPNLIIDMASDSDDDNPFEPDEDAFTAANDVIIIPDSESDDDQPLDPDELVFPHDADVIIIPDFESDDDIPIEAADDQEWLDLMMEYDGDGSDLDGSDLDLDLSDDADTNQPESDIDDVEQDVKMPRCDEAEWPPVRAPSAVINQPMSFSNIIPIYPPPPQLECMLLQLRTTPMTAWTSTAVHHHPHHLH
ncbi:hypothetical protein ACS0TY_007610 [Phlomoides rotata]